MNLVRSTHSEAAFKGVPVTLEVSHLKHTDVDLLHSLIEIWLNQNCQAEWKIEQFEEGGDDHHPHIFLQIRFQDPREAIYFKLSPQFLHNRPISALFLCHADIFRVGV